MGDLGIQLPDALVDLLHGGVGPNLGLEVPQLGAQVVPLPVQGIQIFPQALLLLLQLVFAVDTHKTGISCIEFHEVDTLERAFPFSLSVLR